MTLEWSSDLAAISPAQALAAELTEQACGAWVLKPAVIGWWLLPDAGIGFAPIWSWTVAGAFRQLRAASLAAWDRS